MAASVAQAQARTEGYLERIEAERASLHQGVGALPESSLPAGTTRYSGKVRDVYRLPDGRVVMVATGRQSAFDRHLAAIPFKGQVRARPGRPTCAA